MHLIQHGINVFFRSIPQEQACRENCSAALLQQGGYAPLLDGRVREDVTWENYRYYRELLERLCAGKG